MDLTQRPDSRAAFDPVGYVIAAFPTQTDMLIAQSALLAAGFPVDEVIAYSPDQMARQARINIANAGMLASIGQDLNLMRADLAAAEQGQSFLAVRAPKDEVAHRVADVMQRFGATRAQSYGRFVIEELVEGGSGKPQVFESADRGLDTQTTQTTQR